MGEGTRPIVFLTGDHFWPVNPKTWQWVPSTAKKFRDAFDETAKDVDTGDLVKMADAFSKMAKTTAIYLGRIGIDGSSGNHVLRKTLIELDMMNAALDALKQRYGFEGFHLAGQSGGSRLVAGLAGMRGDVSCAVSGSGAVAPKGNTNATEPGRSYFDPVIPVMVKNQSLRFIMITDRADEIVPATQQIGFAEKVRRAGGHVPQFFVSATDDHHHGVLAYTQLAAAGCILGKSDIEIATAVGTINKRNTEFVEQRRKEVAALTRKGRLAAGCRASSAPAAAMPAPRQTDLSCGEDDMSRCGKGPLVLGLSSKLSAPLACFAILLTANYTRGCPGNSSILGARHATNPKALNNFHA